MKEKEKGKKTNGKREVCVSLSRGSPWSIAHHLLIKALENAREKKKN